MAAERPPFITFITGTSASGKTTLYESLRADTDLQGIRFRDIDEDGVPPVGRGAWRQYRVEQLLFEAGQAHDMGLSSVICGITKPHEVFESRRYRPSFNVSFLLVEASDQQVRERLLARSQTPAGAVYDECFDSGQIEVTIEENLRLKAVLRNAVLSLRNGYHLETSSLSQQAMHDQAKAIILKGEA